MTLSAFMAENQRMGNGRLDATEFYGGCQDKSAPPEAVGIACSPVLINASDADRLPQASFD